MLHLVKKLLVILVYIFLLRHSKICRQPDFIAHKILPTAFKAWGQNQQMHIIFIQYIFAPNTSSSICLAQLLLTN
jgi:hypothetical protein